MKLTIEIPSNVIEVLREKNIPEYYYEDCITRFLVDHLDFGGYSMFDCWMENDDNFIDYIENP